jgi:hypothetical protein
VKLNLKVTDRFLWRSSNMYVVQTRPNLITGEQIVLHHYARHHHGKNTNINRKQPDGYNMNCQLQVNIISASISVLVEY